MEGFEGQVTRRYPLARPLPSRWVGWIEGVFGGMRWGADTQALTDRNFRSSISVAPHLMRGLAFLRSAARGKPDRRGMYMGVTADLIRRVHQHRAGTGRSHVVDFDKIRLGHVERHDEIALAIARGKLVKKWQPEWKLRWLRQAVRKCATCGTNGSRKVLRKVSQAPCQARGDEWWLGLAALAVREETAGRPQRGRVR